MNPLRLIDIPVVSFEALWHVGSLDVTRKKRQSYEGQGLSVSIHPDDWRNIARLAGDVWTFTKADNRFCDYYSLTAQQKDAITAWGVAQGYIAMRAVYEISWFDDEWDSTMTMRFLDREEAIRECHEQDADADNIPMQMMAVATSSFPDSCVHEGYIDPHQILTAVWIQECTDLDGVWWDEQYAPHLLSAPRGVIPVHRIDEWTKVVEVDIAA